MVNQNSSSLLGRAVLGNLVLGAVSVLLQANSAKLGASNAQLGLMVLGDYETLTPVVGGPLELFGSAAAVSTASVPASKVLQRFSGGGFYFSTFKDSATFKLLTSIDGVNYADSGASYSSDAKDCSITFYKGRWWACYTLFVSNTQGFGVAVSDDMLTWTHVTDVILTSYFTSLTDVWAPDWFWDGSVLRVAVSCNNGTPAVGPFYPYEIHPTSDDMTAWSAPALMCGAVATPFAQGIDFTIVKVGSTYHAFYKNTGTFIFNQKIKHQTSTVLLVGWSPVVDDVYGSVAEYEGPAVLNTGGNTWYLTADHYTPSEVGCALFPLSSDNLASVAASAPTPFSAPFTTRHGTLLLAITYASAKTTGSANLTLGGGAAARLRAANMQGNAQDLTGNING